MKLTRLVYVCFSAVCWWGELGGQQDHLHRTQGASSRNRGLHPAEVPRQQNSLLQGQRPRPRTLTKPNTLFIMNWLKKADKQMNAFQEGTGRLFQGLFLLGQLFLVAGKFSSVFVGLFVFFWHMQNAIASSVGCDRVVSCFLSTHFGTSSPRICSSSSGEWPTSTFLSYS